MYIGPTHRLHIQQTELPDPQKIAPEACILHRGHLRILSTICAILHQRGH